MSKMIKTNKSPNRGKRRLPSRRKLILVAVVLIVFALIGGVAYWFVLRPQAKSPNDGKNGDIASVYAKKFQDLYANQHKSLEDKLPKDKTGEEKSKTYTQLSNVSSSQGDKAKALDYAKKAVEAAPTVDSYVALGFWLEQNSQYKAAADAYSKAAELARKKGGAEAEYDYQSYMSMKQEVEKKIK